MRTKFGRLAAATLFTPGQRELVIGSLLGDGSLLATTAGYCFRAHHGIAQHALVDWKYAALRNFVRTEPRRSGKAYYFRTVTHPWLGQLRAMTYNAAGRKTVPLELLHESFGPLGLAAWLMDDGSADHACASLRRFLHAKFDLEFTVNRDKGLPRLRCRARSMRRLLELVGPHVIPEMRYKLPTP